jgi:protein gp37
MDRELRGIRPLDAIGFRRGDNCYAMAIAKRLKAIGSPKYQNDGDPRTSGPGFGVTMHSDSVLEPILKWP